MMKISILFVILFMFCISFAAHSVKHDESLSDTERTENMSEINMPLLIPQNFNADTSMLSKTTENGTFHESRSAAGFAARLVANGAPQDMELAEKVLNAVLECQELQEGDAHYGNFRWMREDEVVEDLNAVEFVLENLIPTMIKHDSRLPDLMRRRVLHAIRLGLEEIEQLDVLVAYTNITALDILNTCLGGELLQDQAIAERGYGKMIEWMSFTDANGIPYEYNSPTYTGVTIGALRKLTDLVQHRDTKIRARTMLARLGLTVALHIHRGTGRWAGPYSRAYQPTVIGETGAEVHRLEQWIANGTLPGWIEDVLKHRPDKFQVTETAYSPRNLGITTYHSPSFALGTSVTAGMGGQSNVMIAHYHREGSERPGVLYSRYLINDKWMGDFYHATDRTKSRNLVEEGRFYGVQQGARVIGLYAPSGLRLVSSAKAALIWTQRELVDEIWVGDRRVSELPAEVAQDEIVVIGSGGTLMAVRPLARTDLGYQAPIRLVEIAGDLVLEIYNYLGPQKAFWEMEWPGAFYKGQPQCGFYLEAAERSEYSDGASFAAAVKRGVLKDITDDPFVYRGEKERLWSVEYSRDGETLGLEVDLMEWELKRRWTQDGAIGWPMLFSPVARETMNGEVTVGNAILNCGKAAAWLFASPETKLWAAAYHGLAAAPVTLTVPDGKVEIEEMGMGTIVWDDGVVNIEAIDLKGTPIVTGGRLELSD